MATASKKEDALVSARSRPAKRGRQTGAFTSTTAEGDADAAPASTALSDQRFAAAFEAVMAQLRAKHQTNICRDLRLLLVGKTGVGKSALGNTILGKKLFKTSMAAQSVTATAQFEASEVNGRKIEVMDSPGLFDTTKSKKDTAIEIVRALMCTSPGPHAVLYVIRVDVRYTDEEYNSFQEVLNYFGEEVAKYIILVFTRVDVLQDKNMTFDAWLSTIPPQLRDVLTTCRNKYVLVNNKSKDRKQVDVLFEKVDSLGGTFYDKSPFSKEANENMEKLIDQKLAEQNERELLKNPAGKQLKTDADKAKADADKAKADADKAKVDADKAKDV